MAAYGNGANTNAYLMAQVNMSLKWNPCGQMSWYTVNQNEMSDFCWCMLSRCPQNLPKIFGSLNQVLNANLTLQFVNILTQHKYWFLNWKTWGIKEDVLVNTKNTSPKFLQLFIFDFLTNVIP